LLLVSVAATAAPAAEPGIPRWLKARYDSALSSFRQARFAEAYGRFVELAEAGHPAAARHALWMCESGPALFGSHWDCSPQEILAWAAMSGTDPQAALARIYPATVAGSTPSGRRR